MILGTSTIPLVHLLGLRTVGRRAGVAGAGFIALSPFAVYYSAEARAYATLMFLSTLSVLLLLVALERGRRGWWIGYGLSVAAVLYTHYTGVFVVAAAGAWALATQRGRWRELLLGYGVATVAFLPWIPWMKPEGKGLYVWKDVTTIVGLSHTRAVLNWLVGHPFLPHKAPLILLGAAIAVGLVTMHRAGSWPGRDALRRPAGLVAVLAMITPLGLLAYSYLSFDLFAFPRNLSASLPFAALAVGWVLTRGGQRVALVALALAATGLVIGTAKNLDPSRARPNYPDVARYVDDVARGRDRVFFHPAGFGGAATALALKVYYAQPHRNDFITSPEQWVSLRNSSRVVVVSTGGIGKPLEDPPRVRRLRLAQEHQYPGILPLTVGVYRFDPLTGRHAYRLVGNRIIPATGPPIPIRHEGIEGLVDHSERVNGSIDLAGWTHRGGRPVDKVLAFAGRRLVHQEAPNLDRPDLAKSLHRSASQLGFQFTVRIGELRSSTGNSVQVFAVAHGIAVPLDYWCGAGADQVVGCPGGR